MKVYMTTIVNPWSTDPDSKRIIRIFKELDVAVKYVKTMTDSGFWACSPIQEIELEE